MIMLVNITLPPLIVLALGFKMPRYYFRIAHGNYSGTSDVAFDLRNDDEAWKEMTKVCADLVGGITRALKPTSDENKKSLFRIRLLAEKLV